MINYEPGLPKEQAPLRLGSGNGHRPIGTVFKWIFRETRVDLTLAPFHKEGRPPAFSSFFVENVSNQFVGYNREDELGVTW